MSGDSNGLCRVICCAKREFTKYHGWRDPDLANKPKIRSIPNKMKRFMADLRDELTIKDQHFSKVARESVFTGASDTTRSTFTKQSGSPGTPVLVDIPGSKAAVADLQKWAKLHESTGRKFGTTVIRCGKCDYPYDGTRRRKPPHLYDPVVVSLPQKDIALDEGQDNTSAAAMKDLPSSKVNKVLRMKRRRSSTELYKGLVSVD